MVIAKFHYNRLVHVILTIFPAVRKGLSCSWKQLFAVRSTTEVKIEVIRTKFVMQSAYTSAIDRSLLKWNGRDCDGSMHYAIWFYFCHVTTF